MQQSFCFIYISRIVQNMSQFDFCINSMHQMPLYPNLAHTLLFIQTHRFCPLSSTVSLGQNMRNHLEDPSNQELSLQLKLQNANHETINSASLIKKKKLGCTCKKTKCLKMYCECFSSGKMCTPECACYGCSNCQGHAETVAKAKQLVQNKTSMASKANGSKGCTCKKSQCRKKYCECFNAGISCGDECKCQDCMNGQCHQHQKQKRQQNYKEFMFSAQPLSSFVSF